MTNDNNSQQASTPQDEAPLIPGVGLWGQGYVLRMVENVLLPHQEELGTGPDGWAWLSPSLVPKGERILPGNWTISHNHHYMTLKADPTIGFMDIDVVAPVAGRHFDKAVLLAHSVEERQTLHLVVTTQLNCCPTPEYNRTYLVVLHAKDEEVVLGSPEKAPDMGALLLIAMTLVKHCPDIAKLLPCFDLKMTQAPMNVSMGWICHMSKETKVTKERLAEFNRNCGG